MSDIVEGYNPGLDYGHIEVLQRTDKRHTSPDLSTEAEDHIRQELDTRLLRETGQYGGGYISSGAAYETDHGLVFLKILKTPLARAMFDGEYASLVALQNTDIVTVPRPIKVIDMPEGGAMLVMEYMDLSRQLDRFSATLGDQIARMHLQNGEVQRRALRGEKSVHKDGRERTYVDTFGFHINTCCGFLERDTTWCDSWPMFYTRMVEVQINRIDKNYGDREARELWNTIVPKVSSFFDGLEIMPALLHGDLWVGNIAENDDGPIIYDAGSFYGHREFDMAMSELFDGFPPSFMDAYHRLVPKEPGFEKRLDLYKLFCTLNRWTHFGPTYRTDSIAALKTCLGHINT